MVIPLIVRGAGMAAKGKNVAQAKGWKSGWQASQNLGDSMQQRFENAGGAMQRGGQRAGSAIQRGVQTAPGSAKIAAGAGLMGGLAVGGLKGIGKAHDFAKKQVGAKSAFILIFPLMLVFIDFILNKNGVELNSFFGFLFSGGNIVMLAVASIATSAPYWASVIIYWIFRRPKSRVEWIYPFALFMMAFFALSFGGGNVWVLLHALFALFTFMYLLEGFNQDVPITNVHWIFLAMMFMDIFGLATITKLIPDILSGVMMPDFLFNRLLFPLWFFFYLAFVKDSTAKKTIQIGLVLLYLGLGLKNVLLVNTAFAQTDLTAQKDEFTTGIVQSVTNWKNYATEWLTGRINYAVTGKVEENQFEPLGVYLENVQSADQSYYMDEDAIVWGTVKARTLDDPINIKVGCFAERDKKKLPANDVDPEKKFSVFTLEEQDFACTFNGTKKGAASKLKEGTNTIKAFADFNFETLSYLKVYFIDKERQRAMTREGLDVFEEFSITDRTPVAIYTNGPAKIEMGTTNPLVGVSDSYPAEPSLGIDIQNREGWQGRITKLKELVIFLPEGIDFDKQASCNKEFTQYLPSNCKKDSCTDIVQKECLEVCEGYLKPGETTNNAFESCKFECNENLGRCVKSCDSFFEEGAQKYNGYSLNPKEFKGEKDFEKGIQLRCRFRPQPSILGNAPLTTKSFRVKARYDYQVEKSVSVNVQKDETSGTEGNVGAPLNLMIEGSNGALVSKGSVTLGSSITIVWDKSINDGGGSGDVIRYRIYRKDSDTEEFNNIGEVDADGTASYKYTDEYVSLSGDYKYSYYADALNKDNEFEKSAVILEVTPAGEGGVGTVGSIGQETGATAGPAAVPGGSTTPTVIATIADKLTLPMQMGIDNTYIFVKYYKVNDAGMYMGGVISKVDKNGGEVTEVVKLIDNSGYTHLLVDDTSAYFYDRGSIKRVRKDTGIVATLADGAGTSDMRIDGDNIYWGASEDAKMTSSIKSIPKKGGATKTLVSGIGGIGAFAVDDNYVYFADSSAAKEGSIFIKRLPKSGGSVEIYGTLNGVDWVMDLAADSSGVYWIERIVGNHFNLKRIPKGELAIEELGSGIEVAGNILILDASNVYVLVSDAIKKIPKTGGTPITLAMIDGVKTIGDEPTEIAADNAYIYWVEPKTRQVKKIKKS